MVRYADAIAEVRAYIDGLVRDDVNLDVLARSLVDSGMSQWDGHQKYAHAEIKSAHTLTGNPIPFSFTAVTEE